MDNILPEFQVIRIDEPASTQNLTQFDVASSQCRKYKGGDHNIYGKGKDLNKATSSSLRRWVEEKQNEEQICRGGRKQDVKTRVLYVSESLYDDYRNELLPEDNSDRREIQYTSSEADKSMSKNNAGSNDNICKREIKNVSLLYVAYLDHDTKNAGEKSFSFMDTHMYKNLSWKARELLDSYTLYLQDEQNNEVNPFEIVRGTSLLLRHRAEKGEEGDKTDLSPNDMCHDKNGLTMLCFDSCLPEQPRLERDKCADYHVSMHSFRSSEPLGVELEEVTSQVGGAEEQKLMIKRILPGSQASLDCFLQPGCEVLGVAEKTVQSIDDFVCIINDWVKHKSHRPVNLYVKVSNLTLFKNDMGDLTKKNSDTDGTFLTTGEGLGTQTLERKQPELSSDYKHDLGGVLGCLGRSLDDDIPIILKFHNAHNVFRLRIIWIGYDGEVVSRKDLNPGEFYLEKSYGTHPWVCTVLDDRPLERHPQNHSSPSVMFRVSNNMSRSRMSYGLIWDASQQTLSCKMKSKSYEEEQPYFKCEKKYRDCSESDHSIGDSPIKVNSGCPKVVFTLIGKVLDIKSSTILDSKN